MAAASDRPRKQTTFVIDSSVALAWCFRDERSPYAAAVLDSLDAHRAVVPALWHYEVANALLSGERRRRSTSEETVTWLGFLGRLPIHIDEEPTTRAWDELLGLARGRGLSGYDASYLELALRIHAPLATLDRRLREAAEAAGLALFAA